MADLLAFAQNALLAVALGALIGVEREFSKKQEVAGLRTFSLVSFLGAVSAFISLELGNDLFFLTSYLGVMAFALFTYFYGSRARRERAFGLTTVFAFLLSFLVGGAVLYGFAPHAVLVTVASTIILFGREKVHGFVSRLTYAEVADALELIIVAVILNYFIPFTHADFYGVQIPLHEFFYFILVVSVVSFIGFLASRFFEARRSMLVFALSSGLTSGSAFAIKMRSELASNKRLEQVVPSAVFAALVASYAKDLLFVAYFSQGLAVYLLPTVVIMCGVAATVSYYYYQKLREKGLGGDFVKFKTPFSVEYAAKISALFAAVVIISGLAGEGFGTIGFVLSSFILSIVSSSAVSANTALAFSLGRISFAEAGVTFAFSLIIGGLSDVLFLYSKERKAMVFKMLLFGLLMAGAGVASLILFNR